jgi:hypothetical protein
MTPITARQVFAPVDPVAARPAPARRLSAGDLRPRALVRAVITFYRDPLAWFGVFGTLLIIAYGGGAVLFILHAEVLGELGPSISPWAHWILDSTLGFVGFAPVVAVLVPLTAYVTGTVNAPVRTRPYATVAGILMTLAAAPGPIVHDLLVGRGTWLADRITALLGGATGAVHVHGDGVPQSVSIAFQIVVGVPTYILLMAASLIVVRYAVVLRETARLDVVEAAIITEPAPGTDLRAAE